MSRPSAARRRHIKHLLAQRDGQSCFYCATPFPDLTGVSIDHLIPQCLLAGWKLHNLVLACRACNNAKADRLPQEILRPHRPYRPGLRPRRTIGMVLDALVLTVWSLFRGLVVGGRGVRSKALRDGSRIASQGHASAEVSIGAAVGSSVADLPERASSEALGDERSQTSAQAQGRPTDHHVWRAHEA